jgi:hypothetical protein
MNPIKKRQHGASSVAGIIVLALIGAGIYIGLQYIPQRIESGTVNSILGDIKKAHASKPAREGKDIQAMIGRSLNINQLEDMQKYFTVTENSDEIVVSVAYERELNLLYTKKQINYNKSLTLRKRDSDE